MIPIVICLFVGIVGRGNDINRITEMEENNGQLATGWLITGANGLFEYWWQDGGQKAAQLVVDLVGARWWLT